MVGGDVQMEGVWRVCGGCVVGGDVQMEGAGVQVHHIDIRRLLKHTEVLAVHTCGGE